MPWRVHTHIFNLHDALIHSWLVLFVIILERKKNVVNTMHIKTKAIITFACELCMQLKLVKIE